MNFFIWRYFIDGTKKEMIDGTNMKLPRWNNFYLNDRISNGCSLLSQIMNRYWIVVRFSRLYPNWLPQFDLFVCHLNNLFHKFSTYCHNNQVNRLLLDSFVLRDKQQTVVDIWQSNNLRKIFKKKVFILIIEWKYFTTNFSFKWWIFIFKFNITISVRIIITSTPPD